MFEVSRLLYSVLLCFLGVGLGAPEFSFLVAYVRDEKRELHFELQVSQLGRWWIKLAMDGYMFVSIEF